MSTFLTSLAFSGLTALLASLPLSVLILIFACLFVVAVALVYVFLRLLEQRNNQRRPARKIVTARYGFQPVGVMA